MSHDVLFYRTISRRVAGLGPQVRPARLMPLALGLLAFAGCRDGCGEGTRSEPVERAPEARQETTPRVGASDQGGEPVASRQELPPPTDEVTVNLKKPGNQPRRALRYAFQEGQEESTRAEASNILSLTLNKHKHPDAISPTVVGQMNMKVLAAERDGTFTLQFSIGHLSRTDESNPQAELDPVYQMLKRMEPVTVIQRVTSRGMAIETDFKPEESADQGLRKWWLWCQRLTQNFIPLPEQPIGVGAEWEVIQDIELTASTRQTTTYELLALDGKQGRVRAHITQIARTGTIGKIAKDNIQTRLDGMTGSGTAELSFNLNSAFGFGEVTVTTEAKHVHRIGTVESVSESKAVQKVKTSPVTKVSAGSHAEASAKSQAVQTPKTRPAPKTSARLRSEASAKQR